MLTFRQNTSHIGQATSVHGTIALDTSAHADTAAGYNVDFKLKEDIMILISYSLIDINKKGDVFHIYRLV